MLFASSIGEIAHPFFIVFAWLIERFYSLIPNYAVAIALLTLVVMIAVFPITGRSTRSMMKMQLLAPELKKIQTRYKTPPGTPVAEKQEARQHAERRDDGAVPGEQRQPNRWLPADAAAAPDLLDPLRHDPGPHPPEDVRDSGGGAGLRCKPILAG